MEVTHIIKRDYETSEFVLSKITNAIEKAMLSVGHGTRNLMPKLFLQSVYYKFTSTKRDSEG